MSLQSLAQVVSLTALFNLACNQHDRPLGRKVTGQFDCQVASSCGYEWFVALRYGTLGARTGGASLDFEGEGIGGAWHSADQGTSLEMSWNVLNIHVHPDLKLEPDLSEIHVPLNFSSASWLVAGSSAAGPSTRRILNVPRSGHEGLTGPDQNQWLLAA